MPYSPDSRNKRGRKSLLKGETWKNEEMKSGACSLDSQHTVTRNFIHGRGGPSSVGRAGKNRRKIYMHCSSFKPNKQFMKRHTLNEIYPSNWYFWTFFLDYKNWWKHNSKNSSLRFYTYFAHKWDNKIYSWEWSHNSATVATPLGINAHMGTLANINCITCHLSIFPKRTSMKRQLNVFVFDLFTNIC